MDSSRAIVPRGTRARPGLATLNDPQTILEAGLTELGLASDAVQQDQLLRLGVLLERWNERINLSGHKSAADLMRRLVLESLAISRQLQDPVETLADLGSGAGFPGLPIAITRPETRVLLVEARERRHHFQRAAIRELGLKNVRALRGRIEDLEPVPARIAIAQALAPPAEVLVRMLPWVESGGFVVIPGSEAPPDPGAHARIVSAEIRRYQAPLGGPPRTLWVGRSR